MTYAQFHRVAAAIIKAYQHGGQSSALIKSQQNLLDIAKQVVAALVDLEAVSHLLFVIMIKKTLIGMSVFFIG